MKVLLDTNVLSEMKRPQPNPQVRLRLDAIPATDMYLSVVVAGEIMLGIEKLQPSKRRQDLEQWLAEALRDFSTRILPVDLETFRVWSQLTTRAAAIGRQVAMADGLIAATAIRHGLHLMTRNTKDFQPTGAMLIDPWQP